MKALANYLRRMRCVLTGGHLPVTKSRGRRFYRSCYRCEARIGRGWDLRGLRRPRRSRRLARVTPLRRSA